MKTFKKEQNFSRNRVKLILISIIIVDGLINYNDIIIAATVVVITSSLMKLSHQVSITRYAAVRYPTTTCSGSPESPRLPSLHHSTRPSPLTRTLTSPVTLYPSNWVFYGYCLLPASHFPSNLIPTIPF